jgi:hypothetical protein
MKNRLLKKSALITGSISNIPLIFIVWTLLSNTVHSEQLSLFPSGVFQVHGFAAITAIHTTDNNFLGDTDNNISFDFHELGLNASWLAHPDILFSAQALYRKAGETEKDDQRQLDYAFVDWTMWSGDDIHLNLNLGRVKNPFGLYNETRDVAFIRSGIFLPQSIYPERIRKRMLSGDGAYLRAEYDTDGKGRFQFFVKPQIKTFYQPEVEDGGARRYRIDYNQCESLNQ